MKIKPLSTEITLLDGANNVVSNATLVRVFNPGSIDILITVPSGTFTLNGGETVLVPKDSDEAIQVDNANALVTSVAWYG